MPTKRTIINRPRRPSFSDEALALFAELERVPTRDRKSDEFKAKDHQLARLLGLESEWFCSVASVTDPRRPPRRPSMLADHDHLRVYAVREVLLEAAKKKGSQETQNENFIAQT